MAEYVITKIINGSVYGVLESTCDESGTSGREYYLASVDADDVCVGDIVEA